MTQKYKSTHQAELSSLWSKRPDSAIMIGFMDIRLISRYRFLHTIGWALLLSCLIVAVAATLARATLNLKAALTDKPDIALYLLLPDEDIGSTTLLRAREDERDYLAETKDGPKLVKLKKGEREWYVILVEPLHE